MVFLFLFSLLEIEVATWKLFKSVARDPPPMLARRYLKTIKVISILNQLQFRHIQSETRVLKLMGRRLGFVNAKHCVTVPVHARIVQSDHLRVQFQKIRSSVSGPEDQCQL